MATCSRGSARRAGGALGSRPRRKLRLMPQREEEELSQETVAVGDSGGFCVMVA